MAVIVLAAAPLRHSTPSSAPRPSPRCPRSWAWAPASRMGSSRRWSRATALIVGPAIAGLLAAAIGPDYRLLDAASFAASAVGLLLINRDLQGRRQAADPDPRRRACGRGSSSIRTIPCCGRPSSCSAPSRPSSHRSFLRSPSDHARPLRVEERVRTGASPTASARGRRVTGHRPPRSPNTGRRRPARRGLRDGSRPDRNRPRRRRARDARAGAAGGARESIVTVTYVTIRP